MTRGGKKTNEVQEAWMEVKGRVMNQELHCGRKEERKDDSEVETERER